MEFEAVYKKFSNRKGWQDLGREPANPGKTFFGTRRGSSPQGGWFEERTLTVLDEGQVMEGVDITEGGNTESWTLTLPGDQVKERRSWASIELQDGRQVTLIPKG